LLNSLPSPLLELIQVKPKHHAFLIVDNVYSPNVFREPRTGITIFESWKLLFDYKDNRYNRLVRPRGLWTDQDTKPIRETYGQNLNRMPNIMTDDPLVQYYFGTRIPKLMYVIPVFFQ
jgi:hypothetical protein